MRALIKSSFLKPIPVSFSFSENKRPLHQAGKWRCRYPVCHQQLAVRSKRWCNHSPTVASYYHPPRGLTLNECVCVCVCACVFEGGCYILSSVSLISVGNASTTPFVLQSLVCLNLIVLTIKSAFRLNQTEGLVTLLLFHIQSNNCSNCLPNSMIQCIYFTLQTDK